MARGGSASAGMDSGRRSISSGTLSSVSALPMNTRVLTSSGRASAMSTAIIAARCSRRYGRQGLVRDRSGNVAGCRHTRAARSGGSGSSTPVVRLPRRPSGVRRPSAGRVLAVASGQKTCCGYRRRTMPGAPEPHARRPGRRHAGRVGAASVDRSPGGAPDAARRSRSRASPNSLKQAHGWQGDRRRAPGL
jgi:hypothetical protein